MPTGTAAIAAAVSEESSRRPIRSLDDWRHVEAEVPLWVEGSIRAFVAGVVLKLRTETDWHLAHCHRHRVEADANRHCHFAGHLVPLHIWCKSNGEHRVQAISKNILDVHEADAWAVHPVVDAEILLHDSASDDSVTEVHRDNRRS